MSHVFKVSVLTGIIAMASLACGSDGPKNPTAPSVATAPPPAPAPAPTPVTNVIGQGSSSLQSKFLLSVPFTTTATGTIGVTVDWTFSTNDVDIYLARGTDPCTVEQFNNNQCPFLGFSTSVSAKPEMLSVPNLATGPYTLYIANWGSTQESLSYQVRLTTVAGAATSSASTHMGGAKSAVRGIVERR